jgi:hypothetical protein
MAQKMEKRFEADCHGYVCMDNSEFFIPPATKREGRNFYD